MNYSIWLSILVLTFAFEGCSNSPSVDTSDSIPDTVAVIDTLHIQSDTLTKDSLEVLRDISDWKTEDFIVSTEYKSSASVSYTIEYHREQWKNVENPLLVKYTGCDAGDYFHLNFQDMKGNNYDFGFGNNNLGDYVLCKEDITDNKKYRGKTFLLYWNWEISRFPCCEGEYNPVEAYLPSITKLELQD